MSCPFSGLNREDPSGESKTDQYDGQYYRTYLQLDKVLDAQHLVSGEKGAPAHDEMLFIITHQTYELWFKQILFELDFVINTLSKNFVNDKEISLISHRLGRVLEIQKVLVDQIKILETMTPMDFLDFRKVLVPASGFQSVQFRLLENKLGMPSVRRINYQNEVYTNFFQEEDRKVLEDSHGSASLLKSLEAWLERTPFLQTETFDFWNSYKSSVLASLDEDLELINKANYSTESYEEQVNAISKTKSGFEALFDEQSYNQSLVRGDRRISYKAMKAVLFIFLYRDEPILQLPFKILTQLTEIDEQLTLWRYRHAMMVQRMIGVKIGTGGSSGYYYLKSTVSDRYKVFLDLFNASSYLISKSNLPALPEPLREKLAFHFGVKQE